MLGTLLISICISIATFATDFTTNDNGNMDFKSNQTAASDDWDVDTFFNSILVIDCNLNYYVQKDPECEKDCDRAVYPGDGSPDFSTVKQRTGVDVGIISISTGLESLIWERESIEEGKIVGGHVILKSNDVKKQKRYGVMFAIQSRVAPAFQLHGDAKVIRKWYDEGLRILQLQYGKKEKHGIDERLGYSTYEGDNKGLTELGKEVVIMMNRVGMIIDVAHSNQQTTLDAAALSKSPIIASHANAEAITGTARNKSDEEIVAIAGTGGVICVTPINWMLTTNKDAKATLHDFIAHIQYIVKLVGIEHVGVATDSFMSGWEKTSEHYTCKELAAYDRWKILAVHLHKDGWTDDDLEKLFGGNLRRVFTSTKAMLRKR